MQIHRPSQLRCHPPSCLNQEAGGEGVRRPDKGVDVSRVPLRVAAVGEEELCDTGRRGVREVLCVGHWANTVPAAMHDLQREVKVLRRVQEFEALREERPLSNVVDRQKGLHGVGPKLGPRPRRRCGGWWHHGGSTLCRRWEPQVCGSAQRKEVVLPLLPALHGLAGRERGVLAQGSPAEGRGDGPCRRILCPGQPPGKPPPGLLSH
mmetsp:Transcript_97156/g.290263  ORF Transcript_97156/g.290263 Transcript_97156/m.290263 type:complete len:207 (+) Transcript_97156:229-849(+)